MFRPASVFGYFPAEYSVPGTNLIGPEFGGLSVTSSVTRINVSYSFLYRMASVTYGASFVQRDYSLILLADDPPHLIDLINTLMLHGTMTDGMRQSVLHAVQAIPAIADEGYRWHRWSMALNLVSSSPQYQIQR